MTRRTKSILSCVALIWLAAAVGGVAGLSRYQYLPDHADSSSPVTYPESSRLDRSSTGYTLLFFAHPKCPCTRASLNELARLMTDTGNRMRAYVVVTHPADAPDDWTNTDLRLKAERIVGVQTIIDHDELETGIFNARTSGTVLLYDHTGALKFSGGITAARGHEGDNAGRDAIFEIVSSDRSTNIATPAFGCPLRKKDCEGEMIPPKN